MPRDLQTVEPGVVYHLISRFVDREYFITESLQRSMYLELQGKALKRSDWRPLGYAIMGNHIHLAAMAGKDLLDGWLRPVHSPFAEILNTAHSRIGPVFVRGPNKFPVPNARVGRLLAYIHNNPVRAHVVGAASETNWTSHRAYIGEAEAPRWLDVSLGLQLSGLDQAQFDAWVNDPVQRADRSFSEEAHELELSLAKEQVVPGVPCSEVAIAVVAGIAAAIGIPTARIRASSRGQAEVMARAAAVHCSELLGLTGQQIAIALNISQQRVSVLRRLAPSNDVRDVAVYVCATFRRK